MRRVGVTKNNLKAMLYSQLMGAAIAGVGVTDAARAEQVVLKSADRSIDLTGDLVDFVDQFYVLRTALGDLRISAERVSCEGSGCPDLDSAEVDYVIAGSDTVGQGLMPLLLEGYGGHIDAETTIVATSNPAEVTAKFVEDQGYGEQLGHYMISSTGSSDAFTSLLDQKADLGMSARRITPKEARALRSAGAGNMISLTQERIVAVDGLVMIVHPSNPVNRLTNAQIRDIYAGQITNWTQLGGEDLPIRIVTRDVTSGTGSVFKNRILGEARLTTDVIVAADNSQMATIVTGEQGAIGYVGFAFRRGAKPLSLVNECGIPTRPDSFSAKTEEYALQRRLYLYNRRDLNDPVLQSFLSYAASDQADSVIRKAGFVDLGVETRHQDQTSDRWGLLEEAKSLGYEGKFAADMQQTMLPYDRLSTTFRFRTGSTRLDERGVLDMQRLAQFVEGQPEGSELVMVGFTDDVGAFESNLRLSKDRATAALDKFVTAYPDLATRVKLSATGYGEIAPAACNISESGRAINRRVEVWLKSAPKVAG